MNVAYAECVDRFATAIRPVHQVLSVKIDCVRLAAEMTILALATKHVWIKSVQILAQNLDNAVPVLSAPLLIMESNAVVQMASLEIRWSDVRLQ